MKAAKRVSGDDNIELIARMIRHFVFKSTQVVIQSRTGKKFSYSSMPSIINDSFLLNLEDDPEISTEIKRKLTPNLELNVNDNVCIEIYLSSEENGRMCIELWNFSMTHPATSDMKKERIFEKLSFILRSLLTVTRQLPAYRIARSCPARYCMCYNIYKGEPKLSNFQTDYKCRKITTLKTSTGTLILTCYYKLGVCLFKQDKAAVQTEELVVDSEYYAKDIPRVDNLSKLDEFNVGVVLENTDTDSQSNTHNIQKRQSANQQIVVPFADNISSEATQSLPFQSLLKRPSCSDKPIGLVHDIDEYQSTGGDTPKATINQAYLPSAKPNKQDIITAHPFAHDEDKNDIALFYSHFSENEELEMFKQDIPLPTRLEIIKDQLEVYETDLKNFDDFLNDILQTDE